MSEGHRRLARLRQLEQKLAKQAPGSKRAARARREIETLRQATLTRPRYK